MLMQMNKDCIDQGVQASCACSPDCCTCRMKLDFKVEYHANEYPLKHSGKIAYVG